MNKISMSFLCAFTKCIFSDTSHGWFEYLPKRRKIRLKPF